MSQEADEADPVVPLSDPVCLPRRLELPPLALNVYDWPGRSGPILALPPFPRDARDFDGLARLLAPSWRVLALDPPGCGLSARPRYGYGSLRRATDALSLLDFFGFDAPVLLGLGEDGCLTVALMAVLSIRPPGALVLVAPDWQTNPAPGADPHVRAQEGAIRALTSVSTPDLLGRLSSPVLVLASASTPSGFAPPGAALGRLILPRLDMPVLGGTTAASAASQIENFLRALSRDEA